MTDEEKKAICFLAQELVGHSHRAQESSIISNVVRRMRHLKEERLTAYLKKVLLSDTEYSHFISTFTVEIWLSSQIRNLRIFYG